MNTQETMGKRIKLLREERKLSQTELAVKVGYKEKTSIAKVEAGKVDLPQSKIKAIAEALGTSASYLMGLEDKEADTYYTDPETNAMAQSLFENSDMRVLFDAAKDATPEQLKMAADMLKMFKETNKE